MILKLTKVISQLKKLTIIFCLKLSGIQIKFRVKLFITFRCEIPDAIEKVFATFAKAFNSEAAASGDQENDKKEVSS